MRKRYTYTNTKSNGGGVGITAVVQIVFIILKLVGVINWSWATVLIPTWISLGIAAFIALLWLLVVMFHVWRKK